jgi:hypothetical protein
MDALRREVLEATRELDDYRAAEKQAAALLEQAECAAADGTRGLLSG